MNSLSVSSRQLNLTMTMVTGPLSNCSALPIGRQLAGGWSAGPYPSFQLPLNSSGFRKSPHLAMDIKCLDPTGFELNGCFTTQEFRHLNHNQAKTDKSLTRNCLRVSVLISIQRAFWFFFFLFHFIYSLDKLCLKKCFHFSTLQLFIGCHYFTCHRDGWVFQIFTYPATV